jgi:hypothetical protein
VWNYWTYDRSVRIILERNPHRLDRIDPGKEEVMSGKEIAP